MPRCFHKQKLLASLKINYKLKLKHVKYACVWFKIVYIFSWIEVYIAHWLSIYILCHKKVNKCKIFFVIALFLFHFHLPPLLKNLKKYSYLSCSLHLCYNLNFKWLSGVVWTSSIRYCYYPTNYSDS